MLKISYKCIFKATNSNVQVIQPCIYLQKIKGEIVNNISNIEYVYLKMNDVWFVQHSIYLKYYYSDKKRINTTIISSGKKTNENIDNCKSNYFMIFNTINKKIQNNIFSNNISTKLKFKKNADKYFPIIVDSPTKSWYTKFLESYIIRDVN